MSNADTYRRVVQLAKQLGKPLKDLPPPFALDRVEAAFWDFTEELKQREAEKAERNPRPKGA